MHLTEEEAYLAMFKFLENYYFLTKTDDVGALLGIMNFMEDGKPVDIALWDDWLECIEEVKKQEDK